MCKLNAKTMPKERKLPRQKNSGSSSRATSEDYARLSQSTIFRVAAKNKLSTLRQKAKPLPPTGCLMTSKPGNKKDGAGYASVKLSANGEKLSHTKVEFYIHHLLGMEGDEWQYKQPEQEYSHLCHNTKCLKKGHIIAEDAERHKERGICKNKEVVEFHCSCNITTIHNPCTHKPACILPVIKVEGKRAELKQADCTDH